ncbi:MAG TPA: ABC transporter ATP-binding protein [bacterium (Candidatus Stahlbacteria)]|nr:ABC transporter ATP-binding protein [Candidatus Stahlbacteria bacterium]
MIRLSNITIGFQGKYLFKSLSWQVGDGEKVALIGPNGVGKTTLLKIIAGLIEPDAGNVEISKYSTFGYLPQEGITFAGRALYQEMLSVFDDVTALFREKEQIEEELARLPVDNPRHETLIKRYGELQDEIDKKEGYTVENRIARILSGLGFNQVDWHKLTETFSGGWEMRIALGKLLLQEPTCLLLDEPTNYLDIESIAWLENYLKSFPGTIILTSHDRYFMDKIVEKIAELENGTLTEYHTNFSNYVLEKEKRRESLLAAHKQQQKEIAKAKTFVARFGARKDTARRVKSRERMLAKVKEIAVPKVPKKIKFEFPTPPHCGRKILELKGVSKSYDGRPVFTDVNLLVEKHDRIAVVGVNGAGKSTLLKILAGVLEPSQGKRILAKNVHIGYFAQRSLDMLNPNNTVLSELGAVAPMEQEGKLRSLLGAFLFSGDDVFKSVEVLSGGEKTRLAIAKILLKPSNLLILDEPTNHLDFSGREVLGNALKAYKGTIVMVTHDRSLIDQIAHKVIEVKDGEINLYLGNYTDYIERKKQEVDMGKKFKASFLKGKKKRKMARQQMEEKSFIRQELKKIESLIKEKERRVSELENMLADPELFYARYKVDSYISEYNNLKDELEKLCKERKKLAKLLKSPTND